MSWSTRISKNAIVGAALQNVEDCSSSSSLSAPSSVVVDKKFRGRTKQWIRRRSRASNENNHGVAWLAAARRPGSKEERCTSSSSPRYAAGLSPGRTVWTASQPGRTGRGDRVLLPTSRYCRLPGSIVFVTLEGPFGEVTGWICLDGWEGAVQPLRKICGKGVELKSSPHHTEGGKVLRRYRQ